MDISLSLLLLLAALPAMLLVALCIYIEDGGPVFFIQSRVGRGGRMFPCLKFRSMHINAEAQLDHLLARDPQARREWEDSRKLRKDPRTTRVGGFIRKSSLDELPQFMNVVCGQMSLVGPRPIVPAEVRRYGHRIGHYQSGRPGLTGLWQVSGRSDATYRSRIAMDVVYARAKHPLLDLRIIAGTVAVVLLGRGSY
jgi:exopolysaccharide production protein ExoY